MKNYKKDLIILMLLIFFILITICVFGQTRIVQQDSTTYKEVKVIFTSEQEVVDYYQLKATKVSFIDIKNVLYTLYTDKKGEKYYIVKRRKDGSYYKSLKKLER